MAENKMPVVLVVDDTEASRYAVSRILRQSRFEVREIGTGEEALRLAQAGADLIILDVGLPDMSGYEVCRRLKANRTTATTPVLHLSASFVRSEDRVEGLEGGADGYLTYPLEPRELVATVQALLRVRQAEQEARAQRELLRVTLSSIGDGVIATDGAGIVTFINPIARALTGWGDDAVGRPIDEVFDIVSEKSDRKIDDPVGQVLRTGEMAGLRNHTLLVARDGSRRPIDDTAAPIRNEAGESVGAILVFRDITGRRELERQLQQRSEALVERDQRKDEFLAVLAHELRNPLAAVVNTFAALKVRLAGDAESQRATEIVERQVAHLSRMVDDLLDVSRITQGKFELRKQRIDLATTIAHAVEAVRPFLDEKQHRLEVSLAEGLTLDADPDRVEQVVANLLTNAGKYTPTGGLIRVSTAREGAEAVIRVRDNGIGIRAEVLPRLFQLFQQADRVPGRLSEGLGVGLTLVREMVELHHGTVTAFSAGPDQGSEFVARLPVLPPGTEAARKPAAPAGRNRPLRILVTDDNADAAESMALLLSLYGHEVTTAHDGSRTLAIVGEFRPDVVFLDIGLPRGMDGYEVARRLRQQPELRHIVLIAMTGYGQPEDIERARVVGFNHHLTKPALPGAVQSLLATIAASLSQTTPSS